MKRICVGILGTGSIIRSAHLPALLANGRAEVVALGNLHTASLEALARHFKVETTYSDFDRMAEDVRIDAVINALPNYLHASATIRMLQAGKHVLCEKPMATSVAEARAMLDASAAARRVLLVGHVWRHSPMTRWLREIVRSGRIGAITRVKAHAVVAEHGPTADNWRVDREAAGGGALADVGVHAIDTVSFLFDDCIRPRAVSARTSNRFRQLAVEDSASVHIEYDTQMTAEIDAGWYHDRADSPHGAIELFGSEGYARSLPAQLRVRVDGVWQDDSPALGGGHPDRDPSVYAAQIDHFLDCILEDRQPACDGLAGLQTAIILDAAYRSAASGSSVSLTSSESSIADIAHGSVGQQLEVL